MMYRDILRDDQWERIKEHLPGKPSDCGVTASDNRLFLEAVLYVARTGCPWRDVPERFGRWHSIYMRYNRWSRKGVWAAVAAKIADDPDLKYLMIDGSIVRMHQHGAVKRGPAHKRPSGAAVEV